METDIIFWNLVTMGFNSVTVVFFPTQLYNKTPDWFCTGVISRHSTYIIRHKADTQGGPYSMETISPKIFMLSLPKWLCFQWR